jgi:hypothetical protein
MHQYFLPTSHGVIFSTMPPPTNTTSNTANDRLRTRSKNANTHPGTAAQDALRVNAPRRDPAVIQREKEAANEKKAMKIQEKEENQARNEATKSIADKFRAQQLSEQIDDEAEMPRKISKGRVSISTLLSLTYILVTKKVPTKVSVSGNAKTQAMGPANTRITGKKRKNEPEPQVDASTPTEDAEQAPPPPKKKKKSSIELSQPSSTTTATERNHASSAPSKTKNMDGGLGSTKRPIREEFDEVSVSANLAHPAKKAKVDKLIGPGVPVPIRRSGKIFLIF